MSVLRRTWFSRRLVTGAQVAPHCPSPGPTFSGSCSTLRRSRNMGCKTTPDDSLTRKNTHWEAAPELDIGGICGLGRTAETTRNLKLHSRLSWARALVYWSDYSLASCSYLLAICSLASSGIPQGFLFSSQVLAFISASDSCCPCAIWNKSCTLNHQDITRPNGTQFQRTHPYHPSTNRWTKRIGVGHSQFWLGLVAGLVPALMTLMTLMALMALVALAMAMLAILAMPMAVPMAVLWWTLMALAALLVALLVALVARLGRFLRTLSCSVNLWTVPRNW